MIIFKKRADIQLYLDKTRMQGKVINFVPTMGALHSGHLSLIEAAKQADCVIVSSIFVNPTQFNDSSDFNNYPITLEKDIEALINAGCDALFLPSIQEMYPDGVKNSAQYALGDLENILEGKYRPGHFQGVCQVVHILLNIVNPDNLFLGQKDYQQCMVIAKLISLIKQKTKVIVCPTQRESSGLAMSSRNLRLNETDKIMAASLYESLLLIKKLLTPATNIPDLLASVESKLNEQGFKVDYITIADAENLSLVNKWNGNQKIVALVAAYLNNIRLIDNLTLN